jgi:hypothetical protein
MLICVVECSGNIIGPGGRVVPCIRDEGGGGGAVLEVDASVVGVVLGGIWASASDVGGGGAVHNQCRGHARLGRQRDEGGRQSRVSSKKRLRNTRAMRSK